MITRNFFLSIILLIILSSCGLYNYPYLNAPNVDTFTTGIPSIAKIYNRSDNDPDVFNGYEFYYKYYKDSANITVDDKTIFQTSEPEPEDLTKVGYIRANTVLLAEDNTYYPMIPVDYANRDAAFTLDVDFNDVSSSPNIPPVINYNSKTITLYRQETELNTDSKLEYETFIADDLDEDDGIEIDRTVLERTLSLYVFAYGKEDKVYNIYSKPVWLGRIDY